MIRVNESDFALVADVYLKNRNRSIHSIDDVLDLIKVVKLDIDNIERVEYQPYWDFMDTVANNIKTGKWTAHPYVWPTYIMNADYKSMSDKDIDVRVNSLRNKCINMLKDNNLPTGSNCNRQLLLRWVRNPNGFQDIMSVMKTIVELNKLFSKKGK